MDVSREEGGDETYGITNMSGSDLNAHSSTERDNKEDDETADETNPLLEKSQESSEQQPDDGKIFGISKDLIPFYGVYKLVTKAGPYPLVVLLLLLLAYLHNQLVRYTLSITAVEVAGDLHYGNKSCSLNKDALDKMSSTYPNGLVGVTVDEWTDHCGSSALE